MMPLSCREIGVARLVLTGALSLACGTLVLAQKAPASKADQKPDQKPDPAVAAQQQAQNQAQNQEIEAVYRAADAAMSSGQASGEIPISVQPDFLKAQAGRVWVPLTLTFDSTKTAGGPVTLYFRVTPRGMTAPAPAPAAEPAAGAKDKKKTDKGKDAKSAPPPPAGPSYPYEDVTFTDLRAGPGEPLRIQRGIGVPPGSYDLYVVLHERAPGGKLGVVKQAIDVPNYATGELMTSSIILAQHVNQLTAPVPPDQQSEHPYAFGQTEIAVTPERRFKKSDELIVLFQIYNANISPEKKFSLEATYTFYHQEAGAEKRFNSTEPQPLNNDTMPAGFDPTSANSSIQAGQGIPLQSFPEGAYRLEIKVTDKQNSKVLTQSTTFTVTP
jgi:hypothetical protein